MKQARKTLICLALVALFSTGCVRQQKSIPTAIPLVTPQVSPTLAWVTFTPTATPAPSATPSVTLAPSQTPTSSQTPVPPTPTLSPTIPFDVLVQTPYPACEDAYLSRLRPGLRAYTNPQLRVGIRIRTLPGWNGYILNTIAPGTAVDILEGPECKNNWVWWNVRVVNSNQQGWMAEGEAGLYYLTPCSPANECYFPFNTTTPTPTNP